MNFTANQIIQNLIFVFVKVDFLNFMLRFFILSEYKEEFLCNNVK